MAKGLTYEELLEYAKQHYDKGGDMTFECASREWFNDYVRMFGAITKRDALRMFRSDYEHEREIAGRSEF